jgi:putative DNA modification/repair radical SAM protein
MEELIRVAKCLRQDHGFRGYIHLKTIPEASDELVAEAGLYADRLSINVELPTVAGLQQFAPEKEVGSIRRSMAGLRVRIDAAREEKSWRAPRFAPAGQSTQIIVGADGASDADILSASATLYASYGLKRIYYSAFSPIPDTSAALPSKAPPLQREHRLYEADWLVRYYGFAAEEVLAGADAGMLDLAIDPKLAWALRHRDRFPVDINRAEREVLLRVPGLGVKSVDRILSSRRQRTLRLDDIGRLVGSLKKLRPFIVTPDHRPLTLSDRNDIFPLVTRRAEQLPLFG